MISKGAVTELQTPPEDGFFSSLFLVPKKGGGQRPVINLKKGDWLVKIDLKDAYFSILISKKHRKYLCFEFRDRFYQFNCLPFGLASAPWVFTKTLKPIAALGRELGIRLIVYIDDILLVAETKEKARDQASGLIYLLQCLGFTVNVEKTVLDLPQCLEFLGFMIDTTKMELSLPAQKIKKILVESQQLLEAELVTACTLSRLIGKMNATNQVIPPAPLFYRSLQMDLTEALRDASQDYEAELTLSPDSREELIWWDTQMIKWNGKTVLATEPDLIIEGPHPRDGERPAKEPAQGDLGLLWRRLGTSVA
uniref:Reverse transcriptase domain-containing protein n=1 Tax=Amphimedon queenslandica TaxID=400682 RepID=A0A1X7TWZ5_AMPQE